MEKSELVKALENALDYTRSLNRWEENKEMIARYYAVEETIKIILSCLND